MGFILHFPLFFINFFKWSQTRKSDFPSPRTHLSHSKGNFKNFFDPWGRFFTQLFFTFPKKGVKKNSRVFFTCGFYFTCKKKHGLVRKIKKKIWGPGPPKKNSTP